MTQVKKPDEFFQHVLEAISDAVFLTNEKGAFEFICNNAKTLLGYEAEEIMQRKTIHSLFICGLPEIEGIGIDQEIRNLEKEVVNKWGKRIKTLTNIKRSRELDGSILITCRDVSAEKELKSKVEEISQIYQNIVNMAQVGIGISKGFKVIYANPFLIQYLEYSDLEDIESVSLIDLVHPSDRPLLNKRLQATVAGTSKFPFVLDFHLVTKSGIKKKVRLFANSILLNGEAHSQAIFTDLSEKTELEGRHFQLILDSEALKQKHELIGQISKILLEEVPDGLLPIELERKIAELLGRFSDQNLDWDIFQKNLQFIHPGFQTRLNLNHPNLSQNNQRLATYIRLNLTTKEIAKIMQVKETSVQIGRVRLKKHLKLTEKQDLKTYLHEL